MPPLLTSRQMFVTGIVLTVVGLLATVFGTTVAFAITGPGQVALGVASGTATALAQIFLTLGLVLLAVSPLARMLEQPRKRPHEHTILLRDTLDRRARAQRKKTR